jgi:hypothetical protein
MAGGAGIVAILTDYWDPVDKQALVTATVGSMTDQAIFFDWRVSPNKGAAFVGMAGIAKQIDCFRLDHPFRHGAMDVVAITALDFALQDGMPG